MSAETPASSNTVTMLRELLDAFVANPARFSEWEAKFLASMWRRTSALTGATSTFGPQHLAEITALYTSICL